MRTRHHWLPWSVAFPFLLAVVGCGGSTESLAGDAIPVDGGADALPDTGSDASPSDAQPDSQVDASPPIDGSQPDTNPPPDAAMPDASPATCPAPGDPNKAAICVSTAPEKLKLVPFDQTMDGRGVYFIQVFDKAKIETPSGEIKPIAELIYPDQSNGYKQIGIYQPYQPIRMVLPAGDVFVRVFFVDNAHAFDDQVLKHGVWLGGYDLSHGLGENLPLTRVTLKAGAGKDLSVPLIALRKMTVTVNASPQALQWAKGNAEGPAGFLLLAQQVFDKNASVSWGFGESPCIDLESPAPPHVITGIAMGSGERFLFGWVDDFDGSTTSKLAPGTFFNIQIGSNPPKVPLKDKINIPTDAYQFQATVELNAVMPGTPPANDPISCQ